MSTIMTKPNRSEMIFRPFEMLRREFDDLFGRMNTDWEGEWLTYGFKAPSDLTETADAFQLRMDVPGVKPEEINIHVTGNTVQISGERREEKEEKDKTYHRVERRSGKFCETFALPADVNSDKVQAEFHDGVLTVTLPKNEASKTRTVKVKAIDK